jgi:hypothetical protein
MAARRAFWFAAATEGSNVGPKTMEQLWDEVARLAKAYPTQPLPMLLGDLVEVQDVAFRLLEGCQRPDQTRDLYLLAGVMSGLLTNASLGLGDPHTAMMQARRRTCVRTTPATTASGMGTCSPIHGHLLVGLAARGPPLRSTRCRRCGTGQWHGDGVAAGPGGATLPGPGQRGCVAEGRRACAHRQGCGCS